MAAAQLNPSRRAVLGAAVGLPFVREEGAPPPASASGYGWSPSPGDPGEDWVEGLASFRRAQAAVAEIEAATAGRPFGEEEVWLPRHGAACAAMEAALARAIAAPAPDLAAFAVKLELVLAHAVEPGAIEEAVTEAIAGDCRRLLRRSR
ncbi:MAG: hypothetical protein QOH04_1515 [Sphingomonadales bacterium]|jgi:hypothetical protein|nr:hypothetical protein [Sphingomonadales bacterium]